MTQLKRTMTELFIIVLITAVGSLVAGVVNGLLTIALNIAFVFVARLWSNFPLGFPILQTLLFTTISSALQAFIAGVLTSLIWYWARRQTPFQRYREGLLWGTLIFVFKFINLLIMWSSLGYPVFDLTIIAVWFLTYLATTLMFVTVVWLLIAPPTVRGWYRAVRVPKPEAEHSF
jgi:hypothetical protein